MSTLPSGQCADATPVLARVGAHLLPYAQRNTEYIGDVTPDYFMHKDRWVA